MDYKEYQDKYHTKVVNAYEKKKEAEVIVQTFVTNLKEELKLPGAQWKCEKTGTRWPYLMINNEDDFHKRDALKPLVQSINTALTSSGDRVYLYVRLLIIKPDDHESQYNAQYFSVKVEVDFDLNLYLAEGITTLEESVVKFEEIFESIYIQKTKIGFK